MNPIYVCGVIDKEDDVTAFVTPFYRKIGPIGIWVGEQKAREIIDDFCDNPDNYKQITLYTCASRVKNFGVKAFSKDPNANLSISNKRLLRLIKMFDEEIAKRATGPEVPADWQTEVKGSAIIQSPRYKT